MFKFIPVVLLIAACTETGAPIGSEDRLALEYKVGEQLMNDCNLRGQRCSEWLTFKKEWDEDVSYLTTFEASLARHKARGG